MNRPEPQPAQISLLDILVGLWRRKFMIFCFLVAGLCAGVAVVAMSKPSYESEARIIVESLATPYDQTSGATPESRADRITPQFVASQVAVLDSEDLSRRVIRDLGLAGRGEFEPLANGIGKLKNLLVKTGFSVDPRLMTPEQRALRVLKSKKTVYPIPLSNVIAVRFSAGDPETAARLANAIVETYVLSTGERDSGSTDRAREWLGKQIEDLRTKVSASEKAVERYRVEAGLLKGQTSTLGTQQISELNSQITVAETASGEAEARAAEISRMLRTTGSVDASSEVLGSQVIQALRQQQIAAQGKVSDLSVSYLPGHPKMKAALKEAANVDRQIRREALNIVESLQGQANVAAARAQALRQTLEELKGREGGSLQSEVRLKELEREATANRNLLETMLGRFADASARQESALQPGYARVIQTAMPAAAPDFPKIGPTVLLCTLVGLGLGLGLAFLAEMMVQAARLTGSPLSENRTPTREVPRHAVHRAAPQGEPDFKPDIPSLGMVAAQAPPAAVMEITVATSAMPVATTLTETMQLLSDTASGNGAATSIAELASMVSNMRERGGTNSFCITSVGGNQEAAFVTVALARALKAANIKAIIVDANAARPSIMDFMSLPDGPGLSELVLGFSDFTKVVQRDETSGVHLIRHGRAADATARALISNRMAAIHGTLASIYDMILVHAGEASPQTPAAVVGCLGAIFLAPKERKRDAEIAAATLAERGVSETVLMLLDNQRKARSRMAGE